MNTYYNKYFSKIIDYEEEGKLKEMLSSNMDNPNEGSAQVSEEAPQEFPFKSMKFILFSPGLPSFTFDNMGKASQSEATLNLVEWACEKVVSRM